jgi:hypothetical protein
MISILVKAIQTRKDHMQTQSSLLNILLAAMQNQHCKLNILTAWLTLQVVCSCCGQTAEGYNLKALQFLVYPVLSAIAISSQSLASL